MVAYGQQYERDHHDEEQDDAVLLEQALAQEAIAAAAPPPPPRCATPPRNLYRQVSNLRFDPACPKSLHPQWAVGMRYVLERRLAVLDVMAAREGVTAGQRAAGMAEVHACVAARMPSTLLYLSDLHEDIDPVLSSVQLWASLDFILNECREAQWDENKIPLHVWTRLSTDFDPPDDALLSGGDLDQAKELMRQAQEQDDGDKGSGNGASASSEE